MRYVTLLRGINVGGNSRVPMTSLKLLFENLGFADVITYINSGNVIFSSGKSPSALVDILEMAIEKEYGFHIKVLIRTKDQIEEIVKELDPNWINGKTIKCDIMFLSGKHDNPKVVDSLKLRKDVDNIKYIPGAIIWWVGLDKVLQSGLVKIIGTDLYKAMTVRNCNTVRKLHELMKL